MTEKLTMRDNPTFRWIALLLLALAMFCSYIFMDILSPIKDLMESTRGWDSKAFGTMEGSETFLNVFVFFLTKPWLPQRSLNEELPLRICK